MSFEDALAKLAAAREQVVLLLEAGHGDSPEFEQALKDAKEAQKEFNKEVKNA